MKEKMGAEILFSGFFTSENCFSLLLFLVDYKVLSLGEFFFCEKFSL